MSAPIEEPLAEWEAELLRDHDRAQRYRPHAEIYRDVASLWRWRVVAANGKTLADSGQGYRRQGACIWGLYEVTGGAHPARFIDERTP